MRRSIFPLRDSTGDAASVRKAKVTGASHPSLNPKVVIHQNLLKASEPDYLSFFPDPVETRVGPAKPAPGVGRPPIPNLQVLPFSPQSRVMSVLALDTLDPAPDGRDYWVDVSVELAETTLLGGLCFSGHPGLPYLVSPAGTNDGNFGLAREVRLVWPDAADSEFIDAHDTFTHQEVLRHGGMQTVAFDPVPTDKVTIRFSDLPLVIQAIEAQDRRSPKITRRRGLLMPYLALLRYEEGTRYQPQVPAGVLGARTEPATVEGTWFDVSREAVASLRPEERNSSVFEALGVGADTLHVKMHDGQAQYATRSTAALVGKRSPFASPFSGLERYVPPPLPPRRGGLRLFVRQSEEHPRTISGVKLRLGSLPPSEAPSRPEVLVEVYELDLEHGSRMLADGFDPATSEYCSLLHRSTVDVSNSHPILRFARSTLSRDVLVRLVNISNRIGQLVIDELALVQSAHVAITPRPSRAQTVGQMHYRLVGEGLTDDYARLGDSSFIFAVEVIDAGSSTRVLEARCLADLIHRGNARVLANHRRLETLKDVSRERSVTHESSEMRRSTTSSKGWRRNESGVGVDWGHQDVPPPSKPGFDVFANTEIRTQTEHVGHEGSAALYGGLIGILEEITGPLPSEIRGALDARAGRLSADDTGDTHQVAWSDVWQGMSGLVPIQGVTHLTLPPIYGIANVEMYRQMIASLKNITLGPLAPSYVASSDLNALVSMISPLMLLNGLSVGMSGGVSFVAGGSVSLSGSPGSVLPNLTGSSTDGTVGSVAKQASRQGHSYSQTLQHAGEIVDAKTDVQDAHHERMVTRSVVEDASRRERRRGVEVMWNGAQVDIVMGSVPIGFTLPAGASRIEQQGDKEVRVTLGPTRLPGASLDVWFDIDEQLIRGRP